MVLVLDSGILVAYYDRRDSWHNSAKSLLDEADLLILPTPIIPEVDYFLSRRMGWQAPLALLDDITSRVYQLAELSLDGYERVLEINQQYADLHLGFVDAAVIAIAEELGLGRIATTDRRHFGAVRAKIPLVLLP